MNISRSQEGFLKWIGLNDNEPKSLKSIQNICENIVPVFNNFYPTKTTYRSISLVFLPLYRFGVIEYYGNNRYALSPTCAVSANKRILVSNGPEEFLSKYDQLLNLRANLGLNLFKHTDEIETSLKNLQIPIKDFILSYFIRQLPTIEEVILKWETNTVIDSTRFFYLSTQFRWLNGPQKFSKGVYKKSSDPYSQRVVRLGENIWKLIPSNKSNPDSINIAFCWNQLKNDGPLHIKYFKNSRELIISGKFFPLLIERLLVLNTILSSDIPESILKRTYQVDLEDFNLLNEKFENKIPVYE